MHLGRTSRWECVEQELLHLMMDRKQREKKEPKPGTTFKGTSPVTSFLQVGSTS
jgi:hypothetical protein